MKITGLLTLVLLAPSVQAQWVPGQPDWMQPPESEQCVPALRCAARYDGDELIAFSYPDPGEELRTNRPIFPTEGRFEPGRRPRPAIALTEIPDLVLFDCAGFGVDDERLRSSLLESVHDRQTLSGEEWIRKPELILLPFAVRGFQDPTIIVIPNHGLCLIGRKKNTIQMLVRLGSGRDDPLMAPEWYFLERGKTRRWRYLVLGASGNFGGNVQLFRFDTIHPAIVKLEREESSTFETWSYHRNPQGHYTLNVEITSLVQDHASWLCNQASGQIIAEEEVRLGRPLTQEEEVKVVDEHCQEDARDVVETEPTCYVINFDGLSETNCSP